MTLGGYDKNDLQSDITWYNTTDSIGSWNITAADMTIGDENVNPTQVAAGEETIGPLVNFQIGYPFLGLAANTYEAYKTLIFDVWNPDLKPALKCNAW